MISLDASLSLSVTQKDNLASKHQILLRHNILGTIEPILCPKKKNQLTKEKEEQPKGFVWYH